MSKGLGVRWVALLALLVVGGAAAPAQVPALDTGDSSWMLTSSALVLMMTGPGLALFYSGLVAITPASGFVTPGAAILIGLADGLLYGNPTQLLNQILAVGVTWLVAIAVTVVLLVVLKATIGLRPSDVREIEGLDLSQHGEVGYNLL